MSRERVIWDSTSANDLGPVADISEVIREIIVSQGYETGPRFIFTRWGTTIILEGWDYPITTA